MSFALILTCAREGSYAAGRGESERERLWEKVEDDANSSSGSSESIERVKCFRDLVEDEAKAIGAVFEREMLPRLRTAGCRLSDGRKPWVERTIRESSH